MYRFSVFILLLFCLTVAFGQKKNERIIQFHSNIMIDTDGRIEVHEYIKVYAAGKEIKRGIVREIPLNRKNNKGKSVRMKYDVLSVKCNNTDVKYHTEKEDGNLAIYIGDEDVFLPVGEYEYTIVYQSYGHIGFFDDFDELYWNVTGNNWIFPIEQVSASIILPGNAVAGKTACYTGVKGSTESDCSVENNGNIQVFFTNKPLAPREGLTVAAAFPRDIVKRPPPPTKAQVFWDNNSRTVCGWMGALICMVYFFFSFRKAGKRPEKPVAIPTFKPPRDLSPASIYYLSNKEYDNKAFTASLVEMAVKGSMSIHCKKKKKYSLVNKNNTERLRPEEKQMHETVFADKESVEVNQENHSKFLKAGNILKKSMESQWKFEDFYRENKRHIILGGLLLNLVFVLYMFLSGGGVNIAFALIVASPFIVSEIAFMFSGGLKLKVGCQTFALSIIVTSLLIVFTLVGLLEEESKIEVHWISAVFFAAMSLLYMVYTNRLRGYTADGARLASEIEGFRMYMKTAEEHRLNMITPPERTPELFEKLLPYAIALGVSNQWCKKFNDVLKQFNYRPEWYSDVNNFAIVGFSTSFAALGSSFSSSISSASLSSGSSSWSSGSSGGGFSGGGGGGGGGRGW